MKRERLDYTTIIKCVHCAKWPMVNVNKSCRCWTSKCPHSRFRCQSVDEWNEVNRRAVTCAVRICREYGLLEAMQ